MKKLIGSVFGKYRSIIVCEKDVTKIASTIQDMNHGLVTYNCGNCGWKNYPDMWFVHFRMFDKDYKCLIKYLSGIGNFYSKTFGGIKEEIFYKID